MVVAWGKRKRRTVLATRHSSSHSSDSEDDDTTAREHFRRAFEAKFKPLKTVGAPVRDDREHHEDQDQSEIESDWSGLSGTDDKVEVVHHTQPDISAIFGELSGKRSYMSSRPPKIDEEAKLKAVHKSKKGEAPDEDGVEDANLKCDLALQRLLKESHLLDASSYQSGLTPEGKGRLKALDIRLQDLGAKDSVLQQEKMPLSHRRGIAQKSASRETRRRKEAAENGVILEKVKFAPKIQKRRDRGVGRTGVGKMQGATLKLSARDIRSIEGSKKSSRDGKGRRR